MPGTSFALGAINSSRVLRRLLTGHSPRGEFRKLLLLQDHDLRIDELHRWAEPALLPEARHHLEAISPRKQIVEESGALRLLVGMLEEALVVRRREDEPRRRLRRVASRRLGEA